MLYRELMMGDCDGSTVGNFFWRGQGGGEERVDKSVGTIVAMKDGKRRGRCKVDLEEQYINGKGNAKTQWICMSVRVSE